MLAEFKKFIAKGNVMDLAVGVIIGGAFATITKSLTDDVLMPLAGAIFGGVDFSYLYVRLGPLPEGIAAGDYAALKKAGVAMFGYGAFLTAVINFLILAFIIFLLVRWVNRIVRGEEEKEEAEPAAPTEVELLAEIRDALTKK
ncbi:large conductance mechanosensitive channel protein MscL [Sphingopyxis sp. MWB1]|uniref:large conductance mechanosensitive channel protein MscL n=1 Tax=Sphingopyxis sp. MWB1 TaxID=1537715 RepID=UPI000519EF2F|nr:large conductance mechanosensitive channel protein MscL [Sphingopyxis sp. MWB1]